MCGIFGYIGKRKENISSLITEGLSRLEYRGYDSVGISILDKHQKAISTYKVKGKVAELNTKFSNFVGGSIAIGHTRWATHGIPNDINAHPHLNSEKTISIVHNGIIENYRALKLELEREGYHFISDTDTEIIVHLIDAVWKKLNTDFESAVRMALTEVEGAYGICAISSKEPDKIIVARKGSPILIGVGENENFISSDAASIASHTKNVIYLDDKEMAIITQNHVKVKSMDNIDIPKEIEELTISVAEIEKGGYPHFMLKEIFEQPESIYNSIRGRIRLEGVGNIQLGGLLEHLPKMANAKRIIMCACGTSWHACLVGKYLIEHLAKIPISVEYASEFRYSNPIISDENVVIVISQSGETADTLAALREAKAKGAMPIGICNVVGSSISRETTCGIYTHAGPEIGVASTKAFTAQVSVLILLAIALGVERGVISQEEQKELIHEFLSIPEKIEKMLTQDSTIAKIAEEFKDASNFLYLGRGFNFPVALEGALKLKEISYIHAEGYPAAEMKHGPIALIDRNMPVVFIVPKDALYEKTISNIEEIRAREGRIIAITTEGDTDIYHHADYVITTPKVRDIFSPLLTSIPLQLLAYDIAVLRGCNVDQPRNLAKSVTVE